MSPTPEKIKSNEYTCIVRSTHLEGWERHDGCPLNQFNWQTELREFLLSIVHDFTSKLIPIFRVDFVDFKKFTLLEDNARDVARRSEKNRC